MKKLKLAVCFAALSLFSHAQNWDVNIVKSINPGNPNSFVMRGLSSAVYPIGVATPLTQLVTGYATHNQQVQHDGWETVGSLAIAFVVTDGLKYSINRTRPYIKYPADIHPYKADETGKSFPSGHTAIAFATATSLTLEYKKWYVAVPAYLFATGVGYSRLYLGEHYFSDVAAGAIIGTGSAFLSHWLTKKIFKFKPPQYVRYIEK